MGPSYTRNHDEHSTHDEPASDSDHKPVALHKIRHYKTLYLRSILITFAQCHCVVSVGVVAFPALGFRPLVFSNSSSSVLYVGCCRPRWYLVFRSPADWRSDHNQAAATSALSYPYRKWRHPETAPPTCSELPRSPVWSSGRKLLCPADWK